MTTMAASDARLLAKTVFAKPKSKGKGGSPTEKAMMQAEAQRRMNHKK